MNLEEPYSLFGQQTVSMIYIMEKTQPTSSHAIRVSDNIISEHEGVITTEYFFLLLSISRGYQLGLRETEHRPLGPLVCSTNHGLSTRINGDTQPTD